MAVYDAFIFCDELDLLEVRLQEHWDYVDKFILVQADRTHTGFKKPIVFTADNPRFLKYAHKICVVNTQLNEKPVSAWENEDLQRIAIFSALPFDGEDILYFGDVDEIISKKHWPYLFNRMKKENLISVWLRMFYYFINLEFFSSAWNLPKILKAKVFLNSNIGGCELRSMSEVPMTPFPCGWHFSYATSVSNIMAKISSFAHQEYNTPEFNTSERIQNAIRNKQDLFGRNVQLRACSVDDSWPTMMRESAYWKEYILPLNKMEIVKEKVGAFKEGLVPEVKKLVGSFRGLSWGQEKETGANEFSKKTFAELIGSRPQHVRADEWRKLIESFCFMLPKLDGWFSAKQCAQLFMKIISSVKPHSKIVEVGSWKGRSSVFASRAASVKDSTLYCVDTWAGNLGEGEDHPTVKMAQQENVFQTFQKNIELYGCDNVVVCRGESVEVAKQWQHGPIDFLFIDASHDYDSVLKDLQAWVPLLKPGGVVCGDDWNRDECADLKGSVRKAFQDFFKVSDPSMGIVERFWAHQPI